MRHHSSIADSRPGPQVRPQTPSDLFHNCSGAFMREPVPGTLPIGGGLRVDATFFTEKRAAGQFVATIPVTVEALLDRVRQLVRRRLASANGAPVGDN